METIGAIMIGILLLVVAFLLWRNYCICRECIELERENRELRRLLRDLIDSTKETTDAIRSVVATTWEA